MARVLISFLGTGALIGDRSARQYRVANYRFDDSDKDFRYSFVAAAIHTKYQVDKIFLLGTVHSMWDEVYSYFGSKNNHFNENIWCEISDYCTAANHKSELTIPHIEHIEAALGNGSKVIPIRYGLNSQEIRENSNIILGLEHYLEKGDELIIDITHSFRSLPMYVMNLLIYLRNVSEKKIRISHICYGMLEMVSELGYSPIVEMKNILEANDWISGAYSFLEFGDAYKIAELLGSIDENLKQKLVEFSNVKNLNYLAALENQCQQLLSIRKNEHLPRIAQMVISPVIENFIKQLNIKADDPYRHSNFQYHLACWQYDNHNYAAAYISLNEAIVTRACEEDGRDPLDYGRRESMKHLFGILRQPEDHKSDAKKRIEAIIADKANLTAYAYLFKEVSSNRNAIAHNRRGDADNPQRMIEDLANYLNKYKLLIFG